MTADENILAQLQHLLEHGTMARSQCSGSFLDTLRPMWDAGVVVEERSGAGRRLVVKDAAAFEEFRRRRFPDHLGGKDAGNRAAGVARFRDSKSFPSDTPEIISVRAWREEALRQEGQSAAAARATTEHGVFSFLLEPDCSHTLHGPCALVENPAVFTRFEQLLPEVDLVIYGQGRASNRLVDWLAKQTSQDFTLLHLPDYDPVGLDEFARLRARLGSRTSLHFPTGLAERFARFGNRSLLDKPNSQALLAKLRRSELDEVRRVVALINRHNAGLEQEALLLSC